LYKNFTIVKISLDETSMGIPISEELLLKYGGIVEPVRFSSESKEALISTLRILFERQMIRIPNHEKLLFQLMNMERSTTPTGKIKYVHAGKNKHDDRVWSLCLAIVGVIGESADVGIDFGKELEAKKTNDKLISILNPRQGEGKYGFVQR
jgi:phage FluMu gp28-like protein